MSARSLMTFPTGVVEAVRMICPTSSFRLVRWAWQDRHFSYLSIKASNIFHPNLQMKGIISKYGTPQYRGQFEYSGTSDKRPSEKGTPFPTSEKRTTSQQRTGRLRGSGFHCSRTDLWSLCMSRPPWGGEERLLLMTGPKLFSTNLTTLQPQLTYLRKAETKGHIRIPLHPLKRTLHARN